MGGPMAARLLEARYPLAVYSRTKSRASRLIVQGARFLETPAEVARESDIVFICVTDTPDVEAVIRGDDGIAAGGSKRPDRRRSLHDFPRLHAARLPRISPKPAPIFSTPPSAAETPARRTGRSLSWSAATRPPSSVWNPY